MMGPAFVETDDSGAASGLPASGDSAGEQPVATIADTVIMEYMELRFMIYPQGSYSGIAIVVPTYQAIYSVTKESPMSALGR
jgi:hypothetical protein